MLLNSMLALLGALPMAALFAFVCAVDTSAEECKPSMAAFFRKEDLLFLEYKPRLVKLSWLVKYKGFPATLWELSMRIAIGKCRLERRKSPGLCRDRSPWDLRPTARRRTDETANISRIIRSLRWT
jgi:hypothetical protein